MVKWRATELYRLFWSGTPWVRSRLLHVLRWLIFAGFAFGYAVVRMIDALTLRYAFVLIAVLGEAVWAIGMLMILVGKPMRRATAQRYWKLVEETGATAH